MRVGSRVPNYLPGAIEKDEGHAVLRGVLVELKFEVFAVSDLDPPSGTQITQKSACATVTFEGGGFKATGHSRMQEPRFSLIFRRIDERVQQSSQRRVLAGVGGTRGAAIRAWRLTRLLALADEAVPQIEPAVTVAAAKS
jgi:hypothetical protein